MKKFYLSCVALSTLFFSHAHAQVGISSNPDFKPDASSILDISSPDKGILIPRVKLTSNALLAPVSIASTTPPTTTTPTSLLVYNTGSSEASVPTENKVYPGFYYWDTNKWVRMTNQNDIDLRMVGTNNHITKDAGVGGTGNSAGTGTGNIGIGKSSLNAITTGTNNIAIGALTLGKSKSSEGAIAIGYDALSNFDGINEPGIMPVAIGFQALKNSVGGGNSGRYNTAIGTFTLTNANSANFVTAVGSNALNKVTTGNHNTGVGHYSLYEMTSGTYNTALGSNSARKLVDGSYNTLLGASLGENWAPSGMTNNRNTLVGSLILDGNKMNSTKMDRVTALGSEVLNSPSPTETGLVAPTNITNSTFIGSQSNVNITVAQEIHFASAIGASSKVGTSHSIVLGRVGTANSGIDYKSYPDNIGMGVIAPTHRLHVKPFGTLDPVKFEGLREDTSATNVVVVNAEGVLKTIPKSNLGGGSSAATEPWLVQGGTSQATLNTQNIYHDGKVSIGSGQTAPTSTAKLFVTGDIETTGKLLSPSSVFADYVFEKYFTGNSTLNETYQFKSLNDVKSFVQANHHLPGVTSIKDITKNEHGYKIDMAQFSMQQLEKIEELYLHVIEQQEQIEELKSLQAQLIQRLDQLENQK